ncbi:MAG: DUF3795 domain-containing protein [Acutalibacteraceae bacterium]
MKGFARTDLDFSLCGLNCGLCPMRLDGYCPGCGGGAGNQSCKIARCAMERGSPAYCFQCADFPCGLLGLDEPYDMVVTRRNQRADLKRAAEIGPAAYAQEQREKAALLRELLENYNDGRRKSLFCTAVNLLPLDDLRRLLADLPAEAIERKDRAAAAAARLTAMGSARGIELKLRRKPKKC